MADTEGDTREVAAVKTCTGCGETKPLEEFGKHGERKRSRCKACERLAARKYASTEHGAAKNLAYRRSEEGKRKRKEYLESEKGKEAMRAGVAKYQRTEKGRATKRKAIDKYQKTEKGIQARVRHQKSSKFKTTRRSYNERKPWRVRCRNAVNNAVLAGKMPHAETVPCSAGPVGCSGHHEYHHNSYREEDWLKVDCMCFFHHRQWHRHNKPIPYEEDAK